MRRRTALALAGSAIGTAAAGCLGSAPDARTVAMTDGLAFDPERPAIASGGTVTWENVGTVAHTVTAAADGIPDGADYFASGDFETEQAARRNVTAGLIEAGGTFDHTFEQPGTYEYYCVPHESSGMSATIRVK